MPSSIWTGAISFGLVQVPVRLVTATKSKDVSFNQLETGTGSRIRYRKVSEASGEEITPDNIVRGYEISKGRYVLVDDDEIQTLRPKGSSAIEIEEFVDLDDIDPLYFEQPYYLIPDKRGAKPYQLLVDAMAALDKVAIGRIVMRSKERLVAIRAIEGMLTVSTMRYADEVVAREGLVVADDDIELTDKERAMARQLVESLASETFDATKYRDEYREQLLDLIQRKAAGEEIVAEPLAEAPAKVLDLVAALEASLARAGTAKDRHPSSSADTEADDAEADNSEADDDEAPTSKATKKAAPKKSARSQKTA